MDADFNIHVSLAAQESGIVGATQRLTHTPSVCMLHGRLEIPGVNDGGNILRTEASLVGTGPGNVWYSCNCACKRKDRLGLPHNPWAMGVSTK